MTTTYSRRRTLALSAGALASVVGAGCLGSDDLTTTIELRATKTGWVGRTPAAIEGTTNPTLRLKSGETYELVWHNGSAEKHKLAVLGAGEEPVHESGATKERGHSRTVAFEAEPKLAGYHDHYHPEEMRGSIEVGSSGLTPSG